jgi:hypothetical protein
MSITRLARFAALILALAAPAVAQNLSVQKPSSLADEDALRVTRDQVQTDRKPLVAKAMNLTDDEARVFWPIYDDYKTELSKLSDRTITLIAGFAANYTDLTDQQANEMTREYLSIEQERLNLREKYWEKFSHALPRKRVARFFQVERRLDAVVTLNLAQAISLVQFKDKGRATPLVRCKMYRELFLAKFHPPAQLAKINIDLAFFRPGVPEI